MPDDTDVVNKQPVKSQKRKSTTLVDEQPRDVKRSKKEPRKPHPQAWIAEEDAALLKGVEKHGLDFDQIKAESGARLGKRKTRSLDTYLRLHHPDKFRELRAATPKKPNALDWTAEEKAALLAGVENHGLDFDKIKAHNDPRLGRSNDRASNSLRVMFIRCYPDKYRELKEMKALAKHEVL